MQTVKTYSIATFFHFFYVFIQLFLCLKRSTVQAKKRSIIFAEIQMRLGSERGEEFRV